MAGQGDYLVLTYQLSGEWEDGARSVPLHRMVERHGAKPVAMVAGVTEDHFMPCVGIDGDGNPFAGVKVGNDVSSIYEGILRSNDGGASWLPGR